MLAYSQTVFMMHMDAKVTPIDNTDYSCYIKPKNLFNQSHRVYITSLVINSLRAGTYTHTHTHAHIQTFANRSNSKKPGTRQPAHAWFNRQLYIYILSNL